MEMVRTRLAAMEWWRAVRYSAVSVMGLAITQTFLVALHGGVGLRPVVANTIAVSTAAIPVFLLNRAWVWRMDGRSSFRREIAPFWAFTLVGLGVSTVAVAVVSAITPSTLAVAAANLGAFGVLWVAKFFLLDEIIFAASGATATTDELVSVAS